MPTFAAPDGTALAFHVLGEGDPLVCLPGGPMRASSYLGDLGGLSAHRQLIMLDLRGTGQSASPRDHATYRCDRQVADVEALREHLGLDRVDVLAHSAGANLALSHLAAHPERVARLVLVTPSVKAIGIDIPDSARIEMALLRKGEPWFEEAFAAYEKLRTGEATDDDWAAVQPFFFGRWDEEMRAYQAKEDGERNAEAARAYAGEGAFDQRAIRAAMQAYGGRVLLLSGGYDWSLGPGTAAEYAGLFPHAEHVVQSGAAHSPWLDDPGFFATTVAAFLSR